MTAYALLTLYRAESVEPDHEQDALEAAENERDRLDALAREIRARIASRQRARDAELLMALHVKLDDAGEPVSRPGAPKGPRSRAAAPTPESPPAEPERPQGPNPGQGDGFRLFMEAVDDRAPRADVEALGWTWEPAGGLTDAATRILVKHAIRFDELDGWRGDVPVVGGREWTMADAPRVSA